MKNRFNNILKFPSITIIIVICLTIIEIHFNLIRWNNKSVINWDVAGYYSYLPALFIDHDISFKKSKSLDENNYNYVTNKQGQHVIKYSVGMAILYAPFFFSAHILADSLNYEPNGYSEIYQAFIEFSGLFYLLFGLIFLRKILLLYFNEKITALSILFIYFGTNLFCYSTIEPAMSHEYTFALFSGFIYYSIKYYQDFKLKQIIILAIIFGLITLVRPINFLFILFPILFGLNENGLKSGIVQLITEKHKHLVIFILIFSLIIFIQLLYWKIVTGNYFYFSYSEEGFFFKNPHIFDSLFGFRKGWIIYSPIILFSLIGIFLMRKQASKLFFLPISLIVLIYFHIVSSWWCWWYGGSFGLRAMIDIYPLLCLSFASFLFYMKDWSNLKKGIVYSFLLLLVIINLIQTYQYKRFVIHYDSMTATAYINSIGKIESTDTDSTLLIHPNYKNALLGYE